MNEPCKGCGHLVPNGEGSTPPPDHCGNCPPWVCDGCGQLDSMTQPCSCWVAVDHLPLADLKAVFASDGSFNVGTNGEVTVA